MMIDLNYKGSGSIGDRDIIWIMELQKFYMFGIPYAESFKMKINELYRVMFAFVYKYPNKVEIRRNFVVGDGGKDIESQIEDEIKKQIGVYTKDFVMSMMKIMTELYGCTRKYGPVHHIMEYTIGSIITEVNSKF